MPRRRRTAAAAVLALLIGLWAGSAALLLPDASNAAAKGESTRGKNIFSKNCVVCHNADGSGGKKLTPNGNPSRDFRDAKFWSERTDEQIRETINKGVAKSGMIAWKGILKPQEIEDVMAYIKTFPKSGEARAKSPPTKPVEPNALDGKAPATKVPGAKPGEGTGK